MSDLSDDDDLLAGEYALGTLDAGERAAAGARRSRDGAFDAAVMAWEMRLAPLVEQVRETQPSSDVWAGILARIARLDTGQPPAADASATILQLSRRVQRWQRIAGAVTALAACLVVWIAATDATDLLRPAPNFVAVLQKDAGTPAYVMKADFRDRTLSIRPVEAAAPEGKSYELWVIDKAIGPPKSLGVLDGATSIHALPMTVSRDVLLRATYAVTVEQQGGSPSGNPTSAPILFGHIVAD